jgi:hypothetical protein
MASKARGVIDSVIDNHHHLICQVCAQTFLARRRDARYCSPACTQLAYRLRHQPLIEPPPLPRRLPKDCQIYQCPQCEGRYLGEQRCPDCGIFCRLLGPGGECPHCGEPVALEDLGLPA